MKKNYLSLFIIYILICIVFNEKVEYDQEEIIKFKEKAKKILIKYNYYENENIDVNKTDFIKLFKDIFTDEGKKKIQNSIQNSYIKLVEKYATTVYPNENDIKKGNTLLEEFNLLKIQTMWFEVLAEDMLSKGKQKEKEDL